MSGLAAIIRKYAVKTLKCQSVQEIQGFTFPMVCNDAGKPIANLAVYSKWLT
ncbi:hypothetical protein Pst134EA_009592 [Puccinia striiformis f. sp. tritici]|uniref:hypothetical protein n=1 Tax=Puccinia striiformis f. sp. tritici TaxID=168172 RepID=UPI002008C6C2|nr:hypothetical protein Pst134EA_009592 [Puccinia striiformis f. sp. tritici]KAH9469069.1 hypothetical protein Pst134EA_009592 [Puccinia striiformis f. sp. tritici]